MIFATTYPGGLTALGLTIIAALAGVISLLVFAGAAVAVKWITSRTMCVLLRTARWLVFCAIGAVFLATALVAIDLIKSGNLPSEVAKSLLMDWEYYAVLVVLFGVEIIVGRLLQRTADRNR